MEAPAKTLRRLAPDAPVAFHDLQPGDFVENGEVHASGVSPVPDPEAVRTAVLERYGAPRPRPALDDPGFEELVGEIRARVEQRGASIPIDAVLVLTDFEPKIIHLRVTPDQTRVEAAEHRSLQQIEPQIVLETRSDLVRSTLRSPFGKDLISIGYGAEVHLRSWADVDSSPHERLLQLLAPVQPRWRQHLRQQPLRTMRFLVGDPSMRYAAATALFRMRRPAPQARTEPAPYAMADWVSVPEG
jgi:hypothetical protein